MKLILKQILGITILAVLMWISLSTLIQAFIKPSMTQTELFVHIPKSFVCNWER